MLFDQFMCLKSISWRRHFFDSRKATISSIFIIMVFFFLNVHLNFNNIKNNNGSVIDHFISLQTITNWINVSIR